MSEVMKVRSVKWNQAEEQMVAEIKQAAFPFEPSTNHVVRVAIRRLHIELCAKPTVIAAHSSMQGLLRTPKDKKSA